MDSDWRILHVLQSAANRPPAEWMGYISTVSPLALLFVGLLWVFFGYRLFRLVLGIVGFALGACAFWQVGPALSPIPLVSLLAAVVGGIVGAIILTLFWFLGLFLAGGAFGLLLAGALGILLPVLWSPPAMLVCAVAGGIAAVLLRRPIMILWTGFAGAGMAVAGLYSCIGGAPLLQTTDGALRVVASISTQWVLAVCSLALGVAGVLVQYGLTGRKRHVLTVVQPPLAAPAAPPPPPAPPPLPPTQQR